MCGLLLFSGMPSDLNQKPLGGLCWLGKTSMCHWESLTDPFLLPQRGVQSCNPPPTPPLNNLGFLGWD